MGDLVNSRRSNIVAAQCTHVRKYSVRLELLQSSRFDGMAVQSAPPRPALAFCGRLRVQRDEGDGPFGVQ